MIPAKCCLFQKIPIHYYYLFLEKAIFYPYDDQFFL